jgi:hypothetical protein
VPIGDYSSSARYSHSFRGLAALDSWSIAWDKLPDEWLELSFNFNPDLNLQRLSEEANGNIWSKMP